MFILLKKNVCTIYQIIFSCNSQLDLTKSKWGRCIRTENLFQISWSSLTMFLTWCKDCFPSKCLWLVLKKLYSDRLELVGGPVFAARGSLRIFDCRKERTFLMVNPPLAIHWEEKRYSSRELIFSILTCQTKKHNQVKATFNQFYCFVGRSCVHRIIALFSGAGWLHLTCLLRQCVMGIGNHYWPDSTNLS